MLSLTSLPNLPESSVANLLQVEPGLRHHLQHKLSFIVQVTEMVLHNPNNWHWVNKDAAPWARDYLEEILTGISAKEGDVTAKVDKVISMDGDVDVNQRKGKVITLFDVKVQLEYSGGWHLVFGTRSLLRTNRQSQGCRGRQWNDHHP